MAFAIVSLTISGEGFLDVKATNDISLYWTYNKYIGWSGAISDNDKYSLTQKIYVVPGETYTFNYSYTTDGYLIYCIYDENDAKLDYQMYGIGTNGTKVVTFTAPDNASYIYACVNSTLRSFITLTGVLGSGPAPSPTPTPIPYLYEYPLKWTDDADSDMYYSQNIYISDLEYAAVKNVGYLDSLEPYILFYDSSDELLNLGQLYLNNGEEYGGFISDFLVDFPTLSYVKLKATPIDSQYLKVYTDVEYSSEPSEEPSETPSEEPSEPQVTPAPTPPPSVSDKVVDLNWKYNTYIDVENGTVSESDYFCCTSDYIELLDNATYTVGIGDLAVENTLFICYFDENKGYIDYSEVWAEVSTSKEVILDFPANVKYIRIMSNAADPDDDIQSAVCDSIYLRYKLASGSIDDETMQGIQDSIQQGNEQSSIQHSEQMAQSSEQHAEQMAQSSEQHAEQMEAEREQTEAQKGILNKITDFFGNFFENLKNFVIGIFVPGPDEMAALFDELNTFFSEKFGFLYYPFDFLIRAFNALMSEGDGTAMVFPGFSIMGYEVWPDIPFDIAENETANNIFEIVRLMNGCTLSLGFINYLRNFFDKRFGGGGK